MVRYRIHHIAAVMFLVALGFGLYRTGYNYGYVNGTWDTRQKLYPDGISIWQDGRIEYPTDQPDVFYINGPILIKGMLKVQGYKPSTGEPARIYAEPEV